jgi:uncharacterized protein (DUF1499 family)
MKRWPLIRGLTLAAAILAFAMMVGAGPGTNADAWPWQVGLFMMAAGAVLGAAAAVVALVLLAMAAHPRFRPRLWLPVAALCVGLAALAPPLVLFLQAREVPPIHDITTDTSDPPVFVALLEERKHAPNGADYGGAEVAAQQATAYPDIKPLHLEQLPRDVMQRAIDAARAMGWEVRASDSAAGRIEATARTWWFGFRDDIVVRIRPEGSGSRVDVRSVSRVGRSDIGANAKRVREFLRRLA